MSVVSDQEKVDNNGDITISNDSNSFSSTSNIFDKNIDARETQFKNGSTVSLESGGQKVGNENGSLKHDVIDGRQGNY
jgi:hypothetical protein